MGVFLFVLPYGAKQTTPRQFCQYLQVITIKTSIIINQSEARAPDRRIPFWAKRLAIIRLSKLALGYLSAQTLALFQIFTLYYIYAG